MVIRATIPYDPKNPQEALPSGYDGSNSPPDYTIPSCGIEDVDEALKRLFDEELQFGSKQVNGRNGAIFIHKPTVIFATGERFAIAKRLRPIRDRNNVLMLPSISIRRTAVEQTNEDFTQRGINQSTGELIIKRRLDTSDRDFQNFLNRFMFKNMDGVGNSLREQGELKEDLAIKNGGLLETNFNNIYEIIAIPQPQFVSLNYEIVFWTSYKQHMNYMIETMFAGFLPQGKMFKLVSPKGYWFIAYVDDSLSSQENVDEFTEDEQIIRYSFTAKVRAYLLAINGPGNAIPVRRYFSAPQISFEIQEVDGPVFDKERLETNTIPVQESEKFILSDLQQDETKKQVPTIEEKNVIEKKFFDPKTGKMKTRYVTISERNKKQGETVFTASSKEAMMDFIFDKKNE